MSLSELLRPLDWLVPPLLTRRHRRQQAKRELEQVRQQVEQCGTSYVTATQSGSVLPYELPADSVALIGPLHRDGYLTTDERAGLMRFFEPARQANALMNTPDAVPGRPFNGAFRMAQLLGGRAHVVTPDSSGVTLYDRALAAIAEALDRLN